MPVEGMEKRQPCPDCGKRVKATYNGARWVIARHADKGGAWCSRGGQG